MGDPQQFFNLNENSVVPLGEELVYDEEAYVPGFRDFCSPLFLIFWIAINTYYLYCVQGYVLIAPESNVPLYVFGFFLCLTIYCLIKTRVVDAGAIPDHWTTEDGIPKFGSNAAIKEVTLSGGVRKCTKCGKRKPDRAHHCRKCRRCSLRMDHHCEWTGRCVGYKNYKFFVLLIFYTCVSLAVWFTIQIGDIIALWDHSAEWSYGFLFMLFLNTYIGYHISNLMAYHIRLIVRGQTTIEFMEQELQLGKGGRKRKANDVVYVNKYDKGWKTNFKDIFGDNLLIAFLPIEYGLKPISQGGGLVF